TFPGVGPRRGVAGGDAGRRAGGVGKVLGRRGRRTQAAHAAPGQALTGLNRPPPRRRVRRRYFFGSSFFSAGWRSRMRVTLVFKGGIRSVWASNARSPASLELTIGRSSMAVGKFDTQIRSP